MAKKQINYIPYRETRWFYNECGDGLEDEDLTEYYPASFGLREEDEDGNTYPARVIFDNELDCYLFIKRHIGTGYRFNQKERKFVGKKYTNYKFFPETGEHLTYSCIDTIYILPTEEPLNLGF